MPTFLMRYFGGQQPNFMITKMKQKQWDEWGSKVSLTVNTYNDVLIMGLQQRFTSGNLGPVTPVYLNIMIIRVDLMFPYVSCTEDWKYLKHFSSCFNSLLFFNLLVGRLYENQNIP
ncbi:Hypothetical_protein [Hexamita inflata]|uniref:Hypothetical_protein n=1 Tax=Hexamita inflata TaxID=28002 RepID=A0ABP1HK02_9EUKA